MATNTKKQLFPENLELKARMVKSGITQGELSKRMGVSRQAINEVLNGHRKGINLIPKINEELKK